MPHAGHKAHAAASTHQPTPPSYCYNDRVHRRGRGSLLLLLENKILHKFQVVCLHQRWVQFCTRKSETDNLEIVCENICVFQTSQHALGHISNLVPEYGLRRPLRGEWPTVALWGPSGPLQRSPGDLPGLLAGCATRASGRSWQ